MRALTGRNMRIGENRAAILIIIKKSWNRPGKALSCCCLPGGIYGHAGQAVDSGDSVVWITPSLQPTVVFHHLVTSHPIFRLHHQASKKSTCRKIETRSPGHEIPNIL